MLIIKSEFFLWLALEFHTTVKKLRKRSSVLNHTSISETYQVSPGITINVGHFTWYGNFCLVQQSISLKGVSNIEEFTNFA